MASYSRDQAVTRIAGGQRNLITTEQLAECGLQKDAIAHRVTGGWLIGEPKTDRGRRAIMLTARAIVALRVHRTRQLEQRLAVGAPWEDRDLVFCGALGQPLHGTAVLQDRFRPLLRRAGLPRIRFHDLRHSAASLLLGQGVHPKVVQEMLGHSTIALTLDIYSHVLPTMQQEAATQMDAVLARA